MVASFISSSSLFLFPVFLLGMSSVLLLREGGERICHAFTPPHTSNRRRYDVTTTTKITFHRLQRPLFLSAPTPPQQPPGRDEDDSAPDPDGASLAAELFQFAQAKGVSLDEGDLLDDDDDDDENSSTNKTDGDNYEDNDDDEEELNIPQGAINAFLGYDTGDVGEKLAGQVDLTNDQLYSEVKERVLDTAGGFVDMVRGPSEDDDDDDDDNGDDAKSYVPPTTVPDSELTAGEVVLLVLDALKNNDNPTPNKGVEILFGFSSRGSQIKNEEGLTPAEYYSFLRETGYEALFDHLDVTIEKGEYSFDGKRGFFTARLKTGLLPKNSIACNFILSVEGMDDDSVWLIDSILIRPQSMRRRRRK